MSSRGDDQAFPSGEEDFACSGVTIREWYAGQALANPIILQVYQFGFGKNTLDELSLPAMAIVAVKLADALLAELEKVAEKPNGSKA